MSFFSASEMAALQSTAELAMAAPVTILRRTVVETDEGSRVDYPESAQTQGWLYSTPSPVITIVSGAQRLVNTYRLYLPVGTDILSGDHVTIGSVDGFFIVSDTTGESTWLPMLVCSLRRAE